LPRLTTPSNHLVQNEPDPDIRLPTSSAQAGGRGPNFFAELIRTIPDYPKPGIQFRDISTLLLSPEGLSRSIKELASHYREAPPAIVAGIEARGFIFGAPLAMELGVGFIPIRKRGKLPGKTISRAFELEYGTDVIEIHEDALEEGQEVLVIDDLLATGGTAGAAVELVRECGGVVKRCGFVVVLPELGGMQRLKSAGCEVHSLCEFEGD